MRISQNALCFLKKHFLNCKFLCKYWLFSNRILSDRNFLLFSQACWIPPRVPKRPGLSCPSLYLQNLSQCLAYRRKSTFFIKLICYFWNLRSQSEIEETLFPLFTLMDNSVVIFFRSQGKSVCPLGHVFKWGRGQAQGWTEPTSSPLHIPNSQKKKKRKVRPSSCFRFLNFLGATIGEKKKKTTWSASSLNYSPLEFGFCYSPHLLKSFVSQHRICISFSKVSIFVTVLCK